MLCVLKLGTRVLGRIFILIYDWSADKIYGKTVPIVRKRDDSVLYVRRGALTKQEARDFRKDVCTEIIN